MIDKILGITLTALFLFYVFRDVNGTASVAKSLGDVYVGGVRALQGR